jgi:hypothetical protein
MLLKDHIVAKKKFTIWIVAWFCVTVAIRFFDAILILFWHNGLEAVLKDLPAISSFVVKF